MPDDAFYWALSMSATAAFTGAAVCLVGRIRRVPRRVAAVLWALPFLRLALPFYLTSRFSLFRLMEPFARQVHIETFPRIRTLTALNFVQQVDTYLPLHYASREVGIFFCIGSVIWLTVAAALLALVLFTYIRTIRQARKAAHLHGRVYLSEHVTGPVTVGILRPRILLPCRLPEEEERCVLLHEEAHIRRRDNLLRVCAITLCCIHWYSPVNWWMLRQSLSAMEEAADETVLIRLGKDERKHYAQVLLAQAGWTASCGSPLGGGALRGRIVRILAYRPMTAAGFALWIVAALGLAWALMTNGA